MALIERQCTVEGQARYVNEQGSVQGGGVDTGGAKFFNWLLKLTNQKRPKVTCLIMSLRLTDHK